MKNLLTNKNQYVIEIATPDNKSLSTLIIFQNRLDETGLKKLFTKLVNHGGSWSKAILKDLECGKLKHTSNSLIE